MKSSGKRLYSVLSIVACGFFILISLLGTRNVLATHSATTNGEIEGRPAPVFRRVCLAGTNAGSYCKQDSECPGSACANTNVFNITVAVMFDASNAQLTSIQTLITSMSAVLFDVTDGQAEIGTATIHNNAFSANQADLVVQPSSNDTWWNANSGHYRTGGTMNVSINYINDPANQGAILAHEFSHLVFDARDEYESRAPGCGALSGNADCPVPASGVATGLMDGNGTELCWGQGDASDVTDLSNGNHDPTNVTEQSSCRNNRSVWDQLVWAWPSTFLKPVGAPDPAANGAVTNPPNFIIADDNVRVVLVLDESGSMNLESPSRIERLKVAASDFIATAESGTELGIVSYSSDANSANGHANVAVAPLVSNRTALENAVSGLSPSGSTNIGDALEKAKDLIVDAGGVTANTYVVLMTDGINNTPSPQASADTDLQEKVDDLLASGIPVYVTCTGGDLGVQSQCAEIANGTNGFNSDSSDTAKLPENFIDFHERITGHQSIDSIYGNFSKIDSYNPTTFFVDEGSESISFVLLWESAQANATMLLKDPDGNTYKTRPIPQGLYARINNPMSGDWSMVIDPRGQSDTSFVARAYTLNRVNDFTASVRKSNLKPNEEMYVYAIARSYGGTITNEDQTLTAIITLPDGTTDTVELFDKGRDASGHGDDLAGDGIYTGVYTNTTQKGAYGIHFDVEVDQWVHGEESHERDITKKSPRFMREVRLSAGVSDPEDKVITPEDDHEASSTDSPNSDITFIKRVVIIILVLLLLAIFLIWRCCCRKEKHVSTNLTSRG